MTKKVTPIRVTDNTGEKAIHVYGKKITGLQKAVEAFFPIREQTILELRAIFSPDHFREIQDTIGHFSIEPEIACNPKHLALIFVSNCLLFERVRTLTSAQSYFLHEMCKGEVSLFVFKN